MSKFFAYFFVAALGLIIGFQTGIQYGASDRKLPIDKTTAQYNELWNLMQKKEGQYNWMSARRDIHFLKKMKCKNIVVRYMDEGEPKDALFVEFSKAGDFNFVKLMDAKKHIFLLNEEKALSNAFQVECGN